MRITIELDAPEHPGNQLPTRQSMLKHVTEVLSEHLSDLKRRNKDFVSLRHFELVSVRAEDSK